MKYVLVIFNTSAVAKTLNKKYSLKTYFTSLSGRQSGLQKRVVLGWGRGERGKW